MNHSIKINATINGHDMELYCDKKSVLQTIKAEIEKQGKDWQETSFFVPHWPEKGRYIEKVSGFISFGSGG